MGSPIRQRLTLLVGVSMLFSSTTRAYDITPYSFATDPIGGRLCDSSVRSGPALLCWACAIYTETYTFNDADAKKVAQVINTRMAKGLIDGSYPTNICGVVYQRLHGVAQFTGPYSGTKTLPSLASPEGQWLMSIVRRASSFGVSAFENYHACGKKNLQNNCVYGRRNNTRQLAQAFSLLKTHALSFQSRHSAIRTAAASSR